MDRPANPYNVGNPVSGSYRFIGRGDVLQDVLRMLRHRHANAIVLYGQRRIGKTSILLHLEAQLAETEAYIPVYVVIRHRLNKKKTCFSHAYQREYPISSETVLFILLLTIKIFSVIGINSGTDRCLSLEAPLGQLLLV